MGGVHPGNKLLKKKNSTFKIPVKSLVTMGKQGKSEGITQACNCGFTTGATMMS